MPPDQRLFSGCIKEKTVLITGAGGSIGSELCRQIMKLKPLTLIMLDQNEYSLYSISEEINNLNNKEAVTIISLIGSVQDEKNINRIFKNGVQIRYSMRQLINTSLLLNKIFYRL